MAAEIIETGTLTAIISDLNQIQGIIEQKNTLSGELLMPKTVTYTYSAGNGIVIENRVISLDELIIDCGVGTTV